jgi:hypothetical protein
VALDFSAPNQFTIRITFFVNPTLRYTQHVTIYFNPAILQRPTNNIETAKF